MTHFRAQRKNPITNDYFSDWYGLYQIYSKKRIRPSKSNWLRYFIFQAKVTFRKDTGLRFEFASAQHYARCPEEGNLRLTNSILTLALDNKTGHCTLKTMILVLYFVTDNIGHLLKTYISLAQATFCFRHLLSVSYTHLTLPTNREV